ncbi:hypothetical protein [Corynebacterium kalidii]|uniref:Uncharacterized protein n=1 Tax=Corynebacterium kalidii TaxID=2931982 RepID=A0A9X1WHP4_9CORY|nr:hypothetical protein [Corynebacterium kalidii]MCJ7859269.1 hypothetical protein [Corynebacterium kalidii]
MAKKDGMRIARLPPGFAETAFSNAEAALPKLGKRIQAGVPRQYSTGIRVERNRAGRPVLLVAITETNGAAIEAKHGDLKRSAAQQGLDVNRYGGG